jgi:hypothetical protein
MDVHVREAHTEAEKQAIYRLRYQVYVEELGCAAQFADRGRRLLVEPIDAHAHQFYATVDGELVGAVRGIARREGPLEHEQLYGLEQFRPLYPDAVSMTTKLVVAPGKRGGRVLNDLVRMVYEVGRRMGIQLDFLSCWPHLTRQYEHLGYRRYRDDIDHPEGGRLTPLVLALEDLDHLRRVGSPLAEVAQALDNSPAAAELFTRRFPDYAGHGGTTAAPHRGPVAAGHRRIA